MSPFEITFLSMVIGALTLFAVTLACVSWIASGEAPVDKKARLEKASEETSDHFRRAA